MTGPLVVHGAERALKDGRWPEPLQPEAVLTVGLPPMSKALRQALGGLPHWHVGQDLEGEGVGWDIWGELRGAAPAEVLQVEAIAGQREAWTQLRMHLADLSPFENLPWSDWVAWNAMTGSWATWAMDKRPSALHVANSASARYVQWMDVAQACAEHVCFHANRGVAGIDGCMSTALGWHAGRTASGEKPRTWLVTGDVAFHYDSNAFLTDPSLTREGLKVVIMNNGGGGLFRWLPGTQHEGVFERHFETPPVRTVASVAQGANARHLVASSKHELKLALEQARDEDGLVFLEVVTPALDSAEAASVFLQFSPASNINIHSK